MGNLFFLPLQLPVPGLLLLTLFSYVYPYNFSDNSVAYNLINSLRISV